MEKKIGRFEFGVYCENRWKGVYKIFNFLPSFSYIYDTQAKEDFMDIKGKVGHAFYFEWFAWMFYFYINIENK